MRRPALQYAVWLLSRSGRSEQELRRKLIEKQYDLEEVGQTLAQLREMTLIDDEKFAVTYARDKSTIYRRGPRRIFLELLRKGVSKLVASEAIRSVTVSDELEAAESLLRAKARQWRELDPLAKKRRALSLLSRRGFSPKVVSQLLKGF